ncbi:MAG: FecR domain-containing protein [Bacteroidota bacterium]|nr:FecR domain-containing protein [Bacteroidota bacterium]
MKKSDTSDYKKIEQATFNISWKKSKEEIWQEVFAGLTEQEVQPVRKIVSYQPWLRYTAVAAVAVIALLFSGMWFYTTTVVSPIASRETVTLPDGSTVLMNAETKITYKPYWWKIQREVKLDGEAFFKVKKGKRFTVVSKDASTTVMGTSFNIYARNDGYTATCMTGKVKVTTASGASNIFLTPNLQANLVNGSLEKQTVEASNSLAWSRHEFFFTSAPLSKVLREISRQYGVVIDCQGTFNEHYTGNFSRKLTIKEALSLVCLPFGINFTAISTNHYLISE